MPPKSNDVNQNGYFNLPGQFEVNYPQPLPPVSYPSINITAKTDATQRKPFYIYVNPVYPTNEKFNNLSPYPNIKTYSPSSSTPSTTAFSAETTEYPYSATSTPRVSTTDENVPETTPYFGSSTQESAVTETTTVPQSDLFTPTEQSYNSEYPPIDMRLGSTTRAPLFKPSNVRPPTLQVQARYNPPSFVPLSSRQPVVVPSYGQRIPTAYPQPSVYQNEVTPSPSYRNDVPVWPYESNVLSTCPCYVMSKNEQGQTSSTTQSPYVTAANPPRGILLLLYPMCPGESVEDVKKMYPSLANAFIIPYQCGACDNKNGKYY